MEMMWNVSDDYASELFTGVFYTHYDAPQGFCFDESWCRDDAIVDSDDPMLANDNNVAKLVELFLNYATEYRSATRTNHVMFTMGTDFNYANANVWYVNMDKLIKYVNAQLGGRVKAFYSTPSCYAAAVNNLIASGNLPRKDDDFFPYADRSHDYWTGYFTSRPTWKGLVRQATSIAQGVKQLFVLSDLAGDDYDRLETLRRALALAQHHDGVSGTAKQAVTNDYIKRVCYGIDQGQLVINNAFTKLATKINASSIVPQPDYSPLLNDSIIKPESIGRGGFAVTIFNFNSKDLKTIVRFPVIEQPGLAYGPDGVQVQYDLQTPFTPSEQNVFPPGIMPALYEVRLPVMVPALGFATYFVQPRTSETRIASVREPSDRLTSRDIMTIENEKIRLTFDANGFLSQFTDLRTSRVYSLSQDFQFYIGWMEPQASGAYIFRPNGTASWPAAVNASVTKIATINGISEVRQTFNSWISQVIRLYPNESYVEFEWLIGPILSENNITREMITRYTVAEIDNAGVVYTDSSGRQMLRRSLRPATATMLEPVAGNYYPVNARIFIRDSQTQLTILTDRSQGGASLANGQIELMLHRRTFVDDQRGVEEPLNEPGLDNKGLIARGRHWLLLTNVAEAASLHRPLAQRLFYTPLLKFAVVPSVETYRANANTQYGALTSPLPDNINLMSLEPWEDGRLVLRLENIFQRSEILGGGSATIDISNLFKDFQIISAQPLKLAANDFAAPSNGTLTMSLNPMEIMTMLIQIQRH